jgi:ribosomal protein S9
MTGLNIITSIFIMAALYGTEKHRFQVIIGIAALVLAPAAFGIIDGADGLIYSLAGACAALLLTMPLLLLKVISRNDVMISVALGGILGAFQYAIAFCIATAFLSIQRMLRIESSIDGARAASDASPYGSGLLAFDEKSALVEIEAMKMLRMDRREIPEPPCAVDVPTNGWSGECAGHASVLPWCAKLAVATLVVLMMGTAA